MLTEGVLIVGILAMVFTGCVLLVGVLFLVACTLAERIFR